MDVTDPVCKMIIDEKDAVATSLYKGKTYHFCTEHCKEAFDGEPEAYLSDKGGPVQVSSPEACGGYTCPMHPEVQEKKFGSCPQCGMALEPIAQAPSLKTEWLCPMHPEVLQDTPGSCPVCGMALEPRTVMMGGEENPELIIELGTALAGLTLVFHETLPKVQLYSFDLWNPYVSQKKMWIKYSKKSSITFPVTYSKTLIIIQ